MPGVLQTNPKRLSLPNIPETPFHILFMRSLCHSLFVLGWEAAGIATYSLLLQWPISACAWLETTKLNPRSSPVMFTFAHNSGTNEFSFSYPLEGQPRGLVKWMTLLRFWSSRTTGYSSVGRRGSFRRWFRINHYRVRR